MYKYYIIPDTYIMALLTIFCFNQRCLFILFIYHSIKFQLVQCRTSNGTQAASDVVFDDNGKQHDGIESQSGPLLSGIAYCISSCCMILLNKVVLSSYNFHAGISLMLYQVIMVIAYNMLFRGQFTSSTCVRLTLHLASSYLI